MKNKKISTAVIRRLPRYYRYLGDLLDAGIVRISSQDLSARMGITASQIRQDLNNFGCFGQQGYGYNVEILYDEVKHILGLDKEYKIILIGCGNFGQAIANYPNFSKRGFVFSAIFDNNSEMIGQSLAGLEIMDVEDLEDYLAENSVDIAALAVPDHAAANLGKILVNAGVKGIWNFSNSDLRLPENAIVENVCLSDSLMTLSYKINEDDILKRVVRDVW
ncbi:MAG: redox-sensing transcriptional repressor Rex [Clostridiales bacterium]|jgi:redox-sensing transcriptional repressor|nr:redox-sensing transcriptional repressor Rex [Clostridiales bacterium]